MLERMSEIFGQVCCKTNSILLEFSGETDHVHVLIDLHPDNNISAFIGSLKSASSRILRKEFESHLQQFYSKPVLWSGSYYVASTGGAPIEKIKAYIKSQEVPN
jgi:putative transposase